MDESAKGLDFLNMAQHDLGEGLVAIQHCDVKPANIVLLGSSAVVCDFGLARILSRNQVTATSASGTPAYMAPEAIAGRPCKTSDQYSLAVTYYHLRTGTLPIADGTLWEVLDAHKTGKLDLSRVPEHEQAVLRRATSLAWEDRFESNGDFVDSLREALRVEGHTRPVMMPSSSAVASPATMPTSPVDPSMTLMPGQDITTPVAAAAVDSEGPTLALLKSGDTKNDSAINGQAGVAAAVATATGRTDAERLWWQQPKWVATGAAAVVLPLLLIVSLSRPGDAGIDDSDPKDGGSMVADDDRDEAAIVGGSATDLSPPTDWLAEAVAKLGSDEAAARKYFDAALAEDPSLLSPVPTLLTGHVNNVMQLAFSRDGKHLVTVADDPAPFAWPLAAFIDRRIGETRFTLNHVPCAGVEDLVIDLVADPSGTSVAFADQSGNLAVASFSDLTKTTGRWKLSAGEPVSIAWRSDASAVVVATDFDPGITIAELAADRSQSPYSFELPVAAQRIAIDPRGEWVVVHDVDGTVAKIAWADVQAARQSGGAPSLSPLTSDATRVSTMKLAKGLSPSESVVITGGELGEITIWPLSANGKQQRQTSLHSRNVTVVAVSESGLAGPIASGDDEGVIGVWFPDGAKTEKRSAHSSSISSLDLSADGRWLAAASLDGEVTLWDLQDGGLPSVRLKAANAGPAHCVDLDDSGRWLAVGHSDGNVALWDLRHAKLVVGKSLESLPRPAAQEQTPSEPKEQQKPLPVT
ncbi:MAG: protein kinase domain-containing protein, partial [Planctomycetaceae bacterium]